MKKNQPDYYAQMKKDSKGSQAIKAEPGNNGNIDAPKGKANAGDGSYADGLEKSK